MPAGTHCKPLTWGFTLKTSSRMWAPYGPMRLRLRLSIVTSEELFFKAPAKLSRWSSVRSVFLRTKCSTSSHVLSTVIMASSYNKKPRVSLARVWDLWKLCPKGKRRWKAGIHFWIKPLGSGKIWQGQRLKSWRKGWKGKENFTAKLIYLYNVNKRGETCYMWPSVSVHSQWTK